MAPTHRLAIDLGTCHTVAVVRRGDEAPRPLLFDGSPLLSSGVYADSNGNLTVGRDAERLSQGEPSRFEPYPKRRVDEGSVLLGETETPVVELLAALLRRVVAEAMQSGINPVGATVLTCPADWGGQRRNVLLAAARSANLGPVELVDEPIAAATYCVRVLGQQIAPLECLAVFDFGGGTLDVSVVRREFDGLRVLAVGGLDDLGGVDIDAALVGHLGQLIELRTPAIWQRLSAPVGAGAQRDRRVFWNEVRGAKEMLSRASSAPVHVPGTEEALHLTREEVERVAGPLIDRAVDETRRVLQRAGVGNAQLAGIFLVGGSSRIPLVSSRLHTRFTRAPTVPEQPELPVAYGGMIAAAGTAPIAPPPPIQRAPMTGSVPVSGSPMSPPTGFAAVPMSPPLAPSGSYPPGPISPPIPSSTSFPPIQVSPGSMPPGTYRPPFMPGPGPGPGPGPMPVPEPPPIGQRSRTGVRRPRSRWPRYVILAVVVALVAGCGYGGYKLIKGGIGAVNGAINNPGGLGAGGAGGPGGNGKTLTDLGKVSLAGEGAVTALAAGGAIYSAVTSSGKTTVTRYDPNGLKVKWSVGVPVEPKDVSLNLVGSLLVIDADQSASHGGKDVRAVLDAANGAQKWLAPHDTQRDVAYLGTDVIVEADSISDATFKRISLLDGKTKWSKPSGISTVTSGHFWSGPVLVNGQVGANTSRALLPWPSEDPSAVYFHEPISVDANAMVTLNNDNGKGAVVNTGNGNPKVSGDLPIDDEHWVAYAGMIVGKLTDDASPGKTVIAGYGLDNLKRRWTMPLNAGDDLERIKPCGPTLICIRASVADSKHKVIAIGPDGKEKWNKVADFADEQDWYLTGSDLLFGEWSFGAIAGEPAALTPDNGQTRISLKSGSNPAASPTVVAADGSHLLLRGVKVGAGATTIWQVAVCDLATGKISPGVDLPGGTDLPKVTEISGDLVLGVTATREMHVWRIPK